MPFTTLMFHEIRENAEFDPNHPSSIVVRQEYHDILPSLLFLTQDHFEEQMAYLKANSYHTLSLAEIKDYYYHNKSLPEKSVLLTFDDCYQSIKKYAYPILKRYGFHAVAFVVTGWLQAAPKPFDSGKSICMAESDLSDIADVFEFANHTDLFHTRESDDKSILMTAGNEEFADDLARCNMKSYISAKDVFAYPFGLFEERNVALLRNKGFQLAFTSTPGRNTEATDPLLLYRNAVPYFMGIDEFRRILG